MTLYVVFLSIVYTSVLYFGGEFYPLDRFSIIKYGYGQPVFGYLRPILNSLFLKRSEFGDTRLRLFGYER